MEAIEVRIDPSGLKGFCCYSVRPIARGEVFFREMPLLSWQPSAASPMEALAAALGTGALHSAGLALKKKQAVTAWQRSSREVQRQCLSLQTAPCPSSGAALATQIKAASDHLLAGFGDVEASEVEAVVGACVVNCYHFEPGETEALFLKGSRFEHSCAPNASFLPQQAEESVLLGSWRALRTIEEGEAVAVSYLLPEELRWSCSARREALRQRFGFHCACARCCTEDICLDDMD